jgi:hypothetical protein
MVEMSLCYCKHNPKPDDSEPDTSNKKPLAKPRVNRKRKHVDEIPIEAIKRRKLHISDSEEESPDLSINKRLISDGDIEPIKNKRIIGDVPIPKAKIITPHRVKKPRKLGETWGRLVSLSRRLRADQSDADIARLLSGFITQMRDDYREVSFIVENLPKTAIFSEILTQYKIFKSMKQSSSDSMANAWITILRKYM